jgi:SAM-dependent methyltransferase
VPFATAPGIKDEQALALLLRCTAAGARDTVLDVACGPGLVVCAFAAAVRHATGIDVTPAMLERGRLLASERGLTNVSWQLGDVLPLPYEDGAFSIVVSRFAFHHLLEPVRVLAEMRRVAAAGGRVAVIDLVASDDPRKAEAFHRMEILRDPSHVRALPLAELMDLFRQVGLPRPRETFYRLESDLEAVLSRSFPAPGDADVIRRMFRDALPDDAMGLDCRLHGSDIRFAYRVAILVADA